RGNHLLLDIAQDVVEMIELTTAPPATGVIFVGGGTPKNYIHQAVLCGDLFGRELRGHNYAIQITMDSPQWGGLSGCTFEECRSWGKEAPDAQTVTIYSDATIALPILVSALAESCAAAIAQRKKDRLAQVNTKP
ncbi:MAG: deoxyhypusine synthase family protein, partial [Dehalococcoidia bacterium]